jgi:hypothetical protein
MVRSLPVAARIGRTAKSDGMGGTLLKSSGTGGAGGNVGKWERGKGARTWGARPLRVPNSLPLGL